MYIVNMFICNTSQSGKHPPTSQYRWNLSVLPIPSFKLNVMRAQYIQEMLCMRATYELDFTKVFGFVRNPGCFHVGFVI